MQQRKRAVMELTKSTRDTLTWILRLSVFGTFLGHGIFAYGIKPNWIPLLTVYGFSKESAVSIMPWIGILDIVVALMALIKPLKIVLLWAVLWAFATAVTRIIAGEQIWEFVERTGNWFPAVALLLLNGKPDSWRSLLKV